VTDIYLCRVFNNVFIRMNIFRCQLQISWLHADASVCLRQELVNRSIIILLSKKIDKCSGLHSLFKGSVQQDLRCVENRLQGLVLANYIKNSLNFLFKGTEVKKNRFQSFNSNLIGLN
jgi:hypothetical protein